MELIKPTYRYQMFDPKIGELLKYVVTSNAKSITLYWYHEERKVIPVLRIAGNLF